MKLDHELMRMYFGSGTVMAALGKRGQPEQQGAGSGESHVPLGRRLAFHCGRAALRLGQWLLQEEASAHAAQAAASHARQAQR